MGKSPRGGEPSLWHDEDFRRLWSGSIISSLGNYISAIAIPLTALHVLSVGSAEMATLQALRTAAYACTVLFAGALLEHLHRRPIMVATNLMEGLVLAAIPVASFLGALTLGQYYASMVLIGVLMSIQQVASFSYLPLLISKSRLLEGNSKIVTGDSVARMLGLASAGAIVEVLGAPQAIAVDALTFFLCGFLLLRIRHRESLSREKRPPMLAQIKAGWAAVFKNPVIRSTTACSATFVLFDALFQSQYILYLSRGLSVGDAEIGVLFAGMGPGALIGAFLSRRLGERFGIGPMLGLFSLVGGAGTLLCVLPTTNDLGLLGVMMLGHFLRGLARPIYNALSATLRQGLVDFTLQSRMVATTRFLVMVVAPIGAVLGGVVGETWGLRPAVLLSGFGCLASTIWLLPVLGIRRLEERPSVAL